MGTGKTNENSRKEGGGEGRRMEEGGKFCVFHTCQHWVHDMFYFESGPISDIHANMCISRQKPGKNKSLALNREPTCMASINTNI